MALSNDLISQFVKATKDTSKPSNEATVYGTIVYDGKPYVRIDGSDLLTPISTTAGVKDGERVTVLIKNHTAVVTGNVSSPSAQYDDVEHVIDEMAEFEILMAYKISAEELAVTMAMIEELKAAAAKITDLEAVTALIHSLEAKYADLENVSADDLKAINADIESLRAIFAEFTDVSTEDLEAVNAKIDNLSAYNANFTYVSAENLKAIKAEVDDLDVKKLDAEQADIRYANIDFSNIGEAAIVKLFSESGIIKDLIVSEGTITGELVGVTIKGDLIEAGTLKADKLVVKGSDGLYYKLNIEAGAVASAEVSEEELQNGLHGTAIIAKTITAEKIAVDDLVAFGATIGGFHITTNSLYSGVKESIHNPTRGIYMGDDGQIAIGDDDNYIKFYEDDNGKHKLEISLVDKLKIGARNLIRNSTDLIFTDYGFHSDIYPVDADVENGVLVLKPYPTSASTFTAELVNGNVVVHESYETNATVDMSVANDAVVADAVARNTPLPDHSGSTGGTGSSGATGGSGSSGSSGGTGKDGISATHSWTGTVLTITSASGTSSADLKGPKGDKGDKGSKGDTGSAGVGIKSITITKISVD